MQRLALRLVVLLLAAAHHALAGEDMSITAPTSIEPNAQVTISWSGGKATFTVRILVNSHSVQETRSVAKSSFVWVAQDVKDGDDVQFWIYDSSGVNTKSPQIPVKQGDTSSAGELTKSSSRITDGGSEKTSSGGRSSSRSHSTQSAATQHTADSSSSSRTLDTGRIPTAPPPSPTDSAASRDSDPELAPADTDLTASTSTLESGPSPTTNQDTATSTSPPVASSAGAGPSSITTTSRLDTPDSRTNDKTSLYLGLGGILVALILLLTLVWWWRKQPSIQSDPKRNSRRHRRAHHRDLYSLRKAEVSRSRQQNEKLETGIAEHGRSALQQQLQQEVLLLLRTEPAPAPRLFCGSPLQSLLHRALNQGSRAAVSPHGFASSDSDGDGEQTAEESEGKDHYWVGSSGGEDGSDPQSRRTRYSVEDIESAAARHREAG